MQLGLVGARESDNYRFAAASRNAVQLPRSGFCAAGERERIIQEFKYKVHSRSALIYGDWRYAIFLRDAIAIHITFTQKSNEAGLWILCACTNNYFEKASGRYVQPPQTASIIN
jgi:hypothetical protein